MSLLHVSGLNVSRRGGPQILTQVDLSVDAGECLAIVGESGSGKSVLARTLLGLTQADARWAIDSETFEVNGADARHLRQRRWRALRNSTISLVLQDALQSLDPLRRIEDEVAEVLAIRGISRGERRAAAIAALTQAGLPQPAQLLKRRSTELSGGMRQRALIASALIGDPALIVADEPTTALDATTAVHITELLAQIRDGGAGLIFISHDLGSVARIADRIAVLQRGRIVEAGPAQQVLENPQHSETRKLLAAAPRGPKPGPAPTVGRTLVSLSDISRAFPTPNGKTVALDGVSLDIRKGEAIGIVGESGCGKTTLARILVGADRRQGGDVSYPGTAPRVRLVPQDPQGSFDPRWSVGKILRASIRSGNRTPEDLLEAVGLDASLLDRNPTTLSGGERQRVAIARALAADPEVLVCDEPVSALDVTTQAGILGLLRGLQHQYSLSLVLISHDLAVVRTVCDRVLVMQSGKVVEQGPTESVFTDPQQPFTQALVRAVPWRSAQGEG